MINAKRSVAAVLLFVLFANLFFFRMIGSMAFSVFSLGFLVYLLAVLPARQFFRNYPLMAGLFTALPAFLFFLMPFRASIFIQMGIFLAGMLSCVYLAYLSGCNIPFIRSVSEFLMVPLLSGLSHLSAALTLPVLVIEHVSGKTTRDIGKPLASAVLGLLFGIPIVVILLALFAGADPIFSKTLSTVLSHIKISEIIWRIIFSFIILAVAAPIAVMRLNRKFISPTHILSRVSIAGPLIVIMSLIALTIGSFLIVQWPYVFATVARETDLSKFGVATYSEYVRKGFGEFLFSGILIYCLTWIGFLSFRHAENRERLILKWLQLAVLAEFTVFLLSVARRILLYWQFHGLSLVRVYGGLFLLYILMLTVILMLRHLKHWQWVKAEIAGTLLFVMFTALWNADGFIVHHHPPTVNNAVDYVYLSRLSADGYDGWVDAYGYAKKILTDYYEHQNDFLSADRRRELAYAGAIIGSLTHVYDRWMPIYGTNRDQQEYVGIIRQSETKLLAEYSGMLNEDITAKSLHGNETTGRLDGLFEWYGDAGNRVSMMKDQLEMAGGVLKLISEHNDLTIYNIKAYRNRGWIQFLSCFYSETDNRFQACSPDYYAMSEKNIRPVPNALDRFFMRNFRYASVFANLKRDIPFHELVSLQEIFSAASLKVASQPKNERGISQDISTESMFLETY